MAMLLIMKYSKPKSLGYNNMSGGSMNDSWGGYVGKSGLKRYSALI